jgi:hypothetical protein
MAAMLTIVLMNLVHMIGTVMVGGIKAHLTAVSTWQNEMITKYATRKWDLNCSVMILRTADVVFVVPVPAQIARAKNGFQWVWQAATSAHPSL